MAKVSTKVVKAIVLNIEDDNYKISKTFRSAKAAARYWAAHKILEWGTKKYWSPGAAFVKQDDRYWAEKKARTEKYIRRSLPIFAAMLAQKDDTC